MKSQRRLRLAAAIVAFACYLSAPIPAAGVRTHSEMGYRAVVKNFDQAEEMLPGLGSFFQGDGIWSAFFSGCSFPDWGYDGGLNPDASEYSHWGPFRERYVKLLKERFPPPWDEKERMHVAFFFGSLVHCVTDIPWHFNHDGHRAFEGLAKEKDGSDADVTGDIFLQMDHKLPVDVIRFWWPRGMVLDTFALQDKLKVTPEQLEKGFKKLQAAHAASRAAAKMTGWHFKSRHPWCAEHYEDYYYGGVEHGAALAAMWIKRYYAELNGWHYYQQMPVYGIGAPDYVPYTGCADAAISSADPDSNAGGEPFLSVGGRGAAAERRALIRFDVSDIPAGAKIRSAKLWLYQDAATPDAGGEIAVAAFGMDRPWQAGKGRSDEVTGTDGVPAAEGDVTWRTAMEGGVPVKSGDCCAGVGCSQDAGQVAVAKIPAETPSARWRCWDVTEMARGWIECPDANNGLVLMAVAGEGVVRFYSSDAFKEQADGFGGGARIAGRPTLIIVPEMRD